LIRELEASSSASINGLDLTLDGKYFVTGGSDKVIKVYDYEEGSVVGIGIGHSSEITALRVADKRVVSVGNDGSIFIWTL
jgi:WD40 repeat protein